MLISRNTRLLMLALALVLLLLITVAVLHAAHPAALGHLLADGPDVIIHNH